MIIRWSVGILVSVVLFAVGLGMLIGKPKRNFFIGYVTPLTMENDSNWNYANLICSIILTVVGAAMIVECVILNVLKANKTVFLALFKSTFFGGIAVMLIVPYVALRIKLKREHKRNDLSNVDNNITNSEKS